MALAVVALMVSLRLVNPETGSAQEPPPDDYTMNDILDSDNFGRVSVGSAGTGSIEKSGDRDFFTVELSETGNYRTGVMGSVNADALTNPRLYGVFKYAEEMECSGAYDDPAVRSYAYTAETKAAHNDGPKQRCWAHLLRDIHDLRALYPDDAPLAQ